MILDIAENRMEQQTLLDWLVLLHGGLGQLPSQQTMHLQGALRERVAIWCDTAVRTRAGEGAVRSLLIKLEATPLRADMQTMQSHQPQFHRPGLAKIVRDLRR